jgi:hypothetical protein
MACCAASGQENHGKYGDSLYFHHGKERLFVNLFIASTLNWKDAGLTVRQDTTFPVGGESTLTLTATAPVTATISIRKPWWAGPAFSVQVNDQPATTAIGPEGYVDLNRTWKSGDRITIILPRTFHLEGFADNTNRAAVMYGPLVMVARTTEGSRLAALRTDPARALASLKPAGDPLTFTADERNFARDFPEPKPVTFQPLFREHEEPFLLFWDRVDDTQWKSWTTTYAAELKRWTTLAPTTVDIAFPGVGTPRAAGNLPGRFATLAGLPPTPGADRNETTARNLRAYTSWQRGMNLFDIQVAGLTHTCRAAGRGNPPWFSYDMTVVPGKPQTLLVRVWTPPAGDPDECRGTERGMEIRVAPVPEGKPPTPDEVFRASTVIGTLPAASSPLGAFEEFRLPLPQSLAAAPRITVICAPQPKRKMGIVSELRIIQD